VAKKKRSKRRGGGGRPAETEREVLPPRPPIIDPMATAEWEARRAVGVFARRMQERRRA
jgi:hypothetical protein